MMINKETNALRKSSSPDRSGKDGTGSSLRYVLAFVPDLQRIAGYAGPERSWVALAPNS